MHWRLNCQGPTKRGSAWYTKSGTTMPTVIADSMFKAKSPPIILIPSKISISSNRAKINGTAICEFNINV